MQLIKLAENATGRCIFITHIEYEIFLSGVFNFDDLYEIYESKELICSD